MSASVSDMLLILCFCFSVYPAAALGLFCVGTNGSVCVCLPVDRQGGKTIAKLIPREADMMKSVPPDFLTLLH